jgi:hypothetical protein
MLTFNRINSNSGGAKNRLRLASKILLSATVALACTHANAFTPTDWSRPCNLVNTFTGVTDGKRHAPADGGNLQTDINKLPKAPAGWYWNCASPTGYNLPDEGGPEPAYWYLAADMVTSPTASNCGTDLSVIAHQAGDKVMQTLVDHGTELFSREGWKTGGNTVMCRCSTNVYIKDKWPSAYYTGLKGSQQNHPITLAHSSSQQFYVDLTVRTPKLTLDDMPIWNPTPPGGEIHDIGNMGPTWVSPTPWEQPGTPPMALLSVWYTPDNPLSTKGFVWGIGVSETSAEGKDQTPVSLENNMSRYNGGDTNLATRGISCWSYKGGPMTAPGTKNSVGAKDLMNLLDPDDSKAKIGKYQCAGTYADKDGNCI